MIEPVTFEVVDCHRRELFPNSDSRVLLRYGDQNTQVWRMDLHDEVFDVIYAAGTTLNPDIIVGPKNPSVGIQYRKQKARWLKGFEGLTDIFSGEFEPSNEMPSAEELLVFSAIMNIDSRRIRYSNFIKAAQLLALDRANSSKTRKLFRDLGVPMSNDAEYYRNLSLPKNK